MPVNGVAYSRRREGSMSTAFTEGKEARGGRGAEIIPYHLGHDLEALGAEVERHHVREEVRRIENAAFKDDADDRGEAEVGTVTARALRRLAVNVPDAEREHTYIVVSVRVSTHHTTTLSSG